jgi:cold shock CspA family protein
MWVCKVCDEQIEEQFGACWKCGNVRTHDAPAPLDTNHQQSSLLMTGTVTSYLMEKRYGFIKGDDNKDYFFHERSLVEGEFAKAICEESRVEFVQRATAKGYRAEKVRLIDRIEKPRYVIPDEFIIAKSDYMKGWEIIDMSHWIVHGSSSYSPDDAKDQLIEHASMVKANAVVGIKYYSTTGSEPGTGTGTHHFTIHNYAGRVVTLGKRNAWGEYAKEDLVRIDEAAEALKNRLMRKTKINRLIFAAVLSPLATLAVMAAFSVGPTLEKMIGFRNIGFPVIGATAVVIVLSLGFYGWTQINYDSWLEPEQ